jgi:hypothetical protein
MGLSVIAALAAPIVAAFLSATNIAQAAEAPISDACTAALGNAMVEDAYKFVAPPHDQAPNTDVKEVALGDVIELKITNLSDMLKNCANQTIVLYLNGYSMTSLKPGPLTIPSDNTLRFTLKFISDVRTTWVPILGYPSFNPRNVVVSAGVQGQYPVKSGPKATLQLQTIGNFWFVVWLALFALLVYAFYWCVRNTNIIRDGDPADEAAGIRRTYSLSKTQGAVWLFVILAAYLLIGLVTGDFANSINSTGLILLGIGAGTVLGSAVIDASKDAQNGAADAKAIADTKAKLDGLDQDLVKTGRALANPSLTPQERAFLVRMKVDQRAEEEATLSAYRKLTGQNEQFLTDILSDANGVSFHRFQMAAWTLVLALVFIKGVYENLAMPTFDTTLMGLLGLSSATYLGLKIPEATTPKQSEGG